VDRPYRAWGLRLRILYFSDNSSDHNLRFIESLAAHDQEIWFLDITRNQPLPGWLPPRVRFVPIQCVLNRDVDPERAKEFLPEFRRVLQEIQPDVVHAGPVQTCGYIAALSGFHPLLIMPWGSDVLFHANRNPEWTWATQVALQGADALFCDCAAVWQATRQFKEFPPSRVINFPWGIKRGSFGPAGERWNLEQGTTNLICTRSWEPLYDIDTLLEAFRLAASENSQLRLWLLGNGSRASSVRSFIQQHKLNDVVRTPGRIARQDLPIWFRSADGYVSCAKTDGTSVSLLEAMATGLPVVVSDIASNREWVTNGKNGWLASVGSVDEFANRFLCLSALGPSQRQVISKHNQRIVAEKADWDRNLPQLCLLYQSLAEAGNRL
jgi:L-malate glycosyltransferase